jgi:predicted small lipoprotein YifL
MKRILAVALLAALAGCSSNAPAATPAAATTTKPSTSDVAYLAAVRPHVQGSTDADLIALGHTACASMAKTTVLDETQRFVYQGFTADAAAAITTAAVSAYCPEYSAQLTP